MDIATVSVIASALVAIAGLLAPALNEALKWRRERQGSIVEAVGRSAVACLKQLAVFRTGNIIEATGRPSAAELADLIAAIYDWEQTIWPLLDPPAKKRAEALRTAIENGDWKSLYNDSSIMAKELLEVTALAKARA